MSTPLPSPNALQQAYERLQDLQPESPIDTSRSSQTLHDILTSDAEAATFLKRATAHPTILSTLRDKENGEYTLFVPVNSAWPEPISDSEKYTSLNAISAHISPHYVSDHGLRYMPNVPTIYTPAGSNDPLIIRTQLSQSGFVLNPTGATIVRANIRACNGIVHYIDQVLLPPPSTMETLRKDSQFTLFHKALTLTEILQDKSHQGGTLFAPTDAAFNALGPETLKFLFDSDSGLAHLRAIVKMHYCPEVTLFSNFIWPKNNTGQRQTSTDASTEIKGQQKQEPPSLLEDKQTGERLSISVAISRFNGLIRMAAANASAGITAQDIATSDGVIHGVQAVLTPDSTAILPPKDEPNALNVLKRLYDPFLA